MQASKLRSAAPNRREFLAGAASLAACAAPGLARAQQGAPLGLQLYTVRRAMAQDLGATLTAVAGMGYDEVEFAGYFGTPPGEIRRLLADTGLSSPAAHIDDFFGPEGAAASPQAWIESALEIGHRYLVLAWLDPSHRRTLDQYRALADTMNGFAERCRRAGLRFAYHNHDFEFAPLDGVQPYDLLMQRCEPDLVGFELDIYWAVHAGEDPRGLLARYPGRFPLCHVKDRAPDGSMADVGDGVIDFAAIFSDPNAGFEHWFTERDDAPDGLESARRSRAGLAEALAPI